MALAVRPAKRCHHRVPSCMRVLRHSPPASPSSPRGQARFCPQLHSRVTDSTLVGATNCRSTAHTAEMREGTAVFIVVFFVSFHPGLGRGRVRSQCPGSMSGSLTSPHGQHREAFLPHKTPRPPRAQPQSNLAGARGMPGLVVLSGPVGRGYHSWGHQELGRPEREEKSPG